MKENIQISVFNNKFILECPFWANELVRNLPVRKWCRALRAWEAPIIRTNVEQIRELIKLDGVDICNNAKKLLDEYGQDRGVRGAGFPHWYKFKRQPRKHQQSALDKGYGLKAYAMFMDMQTGKTKTAIDMTAAHRIEGHISALLVITKLTLRHNWANAFADDCPIPYSLHLPLTSKKKEFERWLHSDHDFKVMIVGWESLSVGSMADMCEQFLLAHHPVAIVGDETNYIQGHKAARSKTVVKLAKLAEYRYALTGTPAAEGPMNLFMQFEYLDTNIIGIGDFYAFRNRYAIMGGFIPKDGPMKGKPTQVVGYQNMPELMELIAPYSFQVMKADVYDLPPKRYQVRHVQLTPEQREIYNKIKKEKVVSTGDGTKAVQNTLELMLRLHQVAGGYTVHPREEIRITATGDEKLKITYDSVQVVAPKDNPKIIELISIVEEARGKQGLVWAVYLPEIKAIAGELRSMGLRVGELHGGIPEDDRQPMIDAFKRGEVDWIVGNASTGGMGYAMHTAEVAVFYNNTFKMRDRLQAEDRCWGDGQTRSPAIIDLIAEKTVDVVVSKSLAQKEDVHNYIRSRIKDITALLDGD